MWRRVDLVWTDVSEERIASIFRVEKSASEEQELADGCRLRRRGSHILKTIGSQMAVILSALRAGGHLSPSKIPATHSVRGWDDPRAIVWLEELGQ
jgi:hypothetical protein